MRLIAVVAVLSFALDQASKWLVVERMGLYERGQIDVWPPFLRFVMGWNQGINFGVLSSDTDVTRWGLIALSLAISAGVIWWVRRRGDVWSLVGAGLVVGGALGNVVDRVRYGAVADFLNMSCCGLDNPYVFNVADIAIFAGAGILILFGGEARPAARGGRR